MWHKGVVDNTEQERNDSADKVTCDKQLHRCRGGRVVARWPYCKVISSGKHKVEKSKTWKKEDNKTEVSHHQNV